MGGCLGLCNTTRKGIKMSITAIKQAVEALTDSVDLVRNEYQDAVDLYVATQHEQPELTAYCLD
jgi:hypothetical protein